MGVTIEDFGGVFLIEISSYGRFAMNMKSSTPVMVYQVQSIEFSKNSIRFGLAGMRVDSLERDIGWIEWAFVKYYKVERRVSAAETTWKP